MAGDKNDQRNNKLPVLRKVAQGIGSRWPSLKYLSFAFYSAWILLTVTSDEAVSVLDGQAPGPLQGALYLSSGIALTACLMGSALFSDKVQPKVERGALSVLMGLVASLCTFAIMGGLGGDLPEATFIACGAGTGIGTAFVCLRVGLVTSSLNGVRATMTICAAALLANLIFFMCQALPPAASTWVISALPLLSAASSFCASEEDARGVDPDDLIDTKALPRGYFTRLVLAVFVIALTAGVAKGVAALGAPAAPLLGAAQSTWEVFASFLVVALYMLGCAALLSFRNVDMSKAFLPICLVMAAGMLVCPLIGGFLPAQGLLIGVMYNMFILLAWCLLIELAGRTTLEAVRVFGFGRGASALATTAGWALVAAAQHHPETNPALYIAFFVVMAIALLAVTAGVLGERTVSEALAKTMALKAGAPAEAVMSPAAEGEEAADLWSLACESIAGEFGLTPRETEVYALLSRGRTVNYIAEELVIAPNTVKGYTKNVYAKTGVHSRQELIDLTEERMASRSSTD